MKTLALSLILSDIAIGVVDLKDCSCSLKEKNSDFAAGCGVKSRDRVAFRRHDNSEIGLEGKCLPAVPAK